MTTITLQRVAQTDKLTQGVFIMDGVAFAVTLELPWRNNAQDISCIPAGTYEAFYRLSPQRGYHVWQLIDVPGRTYVQIHKGTTTAHTKGCIIVAEQFEEYNGRFAVFRSSKGFNELMEKTKGLTRIRLRVIDP